MAGSGFVTGSGDGASSSWLAQSGLHRGAGWIHGSRHFESCFGQRRREVSVEGTKIQVEAQILSLEGMSGHADGGTIVDWVHGIQDAPSIIMLNHGEDEARSALAKRLEAVRDWQVLRTAGEERVEL